MKKDQNDAGENGGKLKWHMRINWFWGQIWQLQDTRLQKEEWLMESEFQFILCKKNKKKMKLTGKIGKCNWKTNKRDSHKVHRLYTHTHVRSRKEKPWSRWSNYQSFSRRAPSSFCFSPCPFLCCLLACKDMVNLVSWSNHAFLFLYWNHRNREVKH